MGFNLFDLLLPRETKFFGYMDQQAQFLVKGAHIFQDLVKNIQNLSEEQIKAKLAEIKDCEIQRAIKSSARSSTNWEKHSLLPLTAKTSIPWP